MCSIVVLPVCKIQNWIEMGLEFQISSWIFNWGSSQGRLQLMGSMVVHSCMIHKSFVSLYFMTWLDVIFNILRIPGVNTNPFPVCRLRTFMRSLPSTTPWTRWVCGWCWVTRAWSGRATPASAPRRPRPWCSDAPTATGWRSPGTWRCATATPCSSR